MRDSIEDKLYIGMSYHELKKILGPPTDEKPGTKMLEGGVQMVISDQRKSYLKSIMFCYWDRPEAEYFLLIKEGKLAKIDSIFSPNRRNMFRNMHMAQRVDVPLPWWRRLAFWRK